MKRLYRKGPLETRSRITFQALYQWALVHGVTVERTGRKIQYWRKGADHTIGESKTVKDAYAHICDNFIVGLIFV